MEISDEAEVTQAIEHGADNLILHNVSVEDARPLIKRARELSDKISIECSGSGVTVDTAAAFAGAGVDLLSINTLDSHAPKVNFKLGAF